MKLKFNLKGVKFQNGENKFAHMDDLSIEIDYDQGELAQLAEIQASMIKEGVVEKIIDHIGEQVGKNIKLCQELEEQNKQNNLARQERNHKMEMERREMSIKEADAQFNRMNAAHHPQQ